MLQSNLTQSFPVLSLFLEARYTHCGVVGPAESPTGYGIPPPSILKSASFLRRQPTRSSL